MFYHAYLRAGCCSLAAAAAGAVLRTARCCNTESYCKHGHSALSDLAFGPLLGLWWCLGSGRGGQRAKALDPRRYRPWPLWPLVHSKGAPPSFPQFWESHLSLRPSTQRRYRQTLIAPKRMKVKVSTGKVIVISWARRVLLLSSASALLPRPSSHCSDRVWRWS